MTRMRLSPARTAVLAVGLPLVVLLCLAVAVYVSLYLRGTEPVNIRYDLAAGTSVVVNIPKGGLTFRASADDRTHIWGHGSSIGVKPTVTARTSGGITVIDGRGCVAFRSMRCTFDLTVTLPAPLPLTVTRHSGDISAADLTGPLELATTNGDIDTADTRGTLELQSTNGSIHVSNAASGQTSASTTNGNVVLSFLRAPTTVTATSTNGNVTVGVPVRGATYFVVTRTTSGAERTAVPTDHASARTITAQTTNGDITIGPS
jgi:Putative adhesin